MAERTRIFIDLEKLTEAISKALPKDIEGKVEVVLGAPEKRTFKPAVTIGHNETKDVWTIPPGKRLHLYGMLISTDTAGKVELYVGNTLFHPLIFNEKKTVPLALPFEFWLPKETPLKAKWISDTNSGNAYITPIGHESEA